MLFKNSLKKYKKMPLITILAGAFNAPRPLKMNNESGDFN